MKFFLLFLILLFGQTAFSQAPSWVWAKSAGGTGYDYGSSISIDSAGNTYVIASFSSSILIVSTDTLINADTSGNTYDIAILKYNISGNLIWAKSVGGKSSDWGTSICIDYLGNFFITGTFCSTSIIFDNDTLTNTPLDSSDIFVVKYDFNGSVIWAKKEGGIGIDAGRGLSVDSKGNIYVAGTFSSSAITFGSTTLTNIGNLDIFIVKYNNFGNVIWAKRAGGNSWDYAKGIAADSLGNAYITGHFLSDTIFFSGNELVNAGDYDIFIAKYDSSGNFVWARSAEGFSNDFSFGITVDTQGSPIITGEFCSNSFTFGTNVLSNLGGNLIFITKYDSNGNVVWVRQADGLYGVVSGQSIKCDLYNNIFITGYYGALVSFGGHSLMGFGGKDIFVVKYSANGNVLWAKGESQASNYNDEVSNSICIDALGNAYITGYYDSPSLCFDGHNMSNVGSSDIFVAKLDYLMNVDAPSTLVNTQSVYPNPFSISTVLLLNNPLLKGTLVIYDMLGKETIRMVNLNGKEITILRKNLNSGVYYYTLTDNTSIIGKGKLVVE